MKVKYTPDTIPEAYKHLFDQGIYVYSNKGALFKKYNTISISLDIKKDDQIVLIELRGTRWNCKAKNIFIRANLKNNRLYRKNSEQIFDIIEWTKKAGSIITGGGQKDHPRNKQFWYEYENIKRAYPEYFL